AAPAETLAKVRVNNRLRGAIEAALGSLTISSGNAQDRLAAAQEALKHPPSDGGAALAKAMASEKSPAVRQALTLAIAAAKLGHGDKAEQLAALSELARSSDPQIRSLLIERRDQGALDPEVKRALDA